MNTVLTLTIYLSTNKSHIYWSLWSWCKAPACLMEGIRDIGHDFKLKIRGWWIVALAKWLATLPISLFGICPTVIFCAICFVIDIDFNQAGSCSGCCENYGSKSRPKKFLFWPYFVCLPEESWFSWHTKRFLLEQGLSKKAPLRTMRAQSSSDDLVWPLGSTPPLWFQLALAATSGDTWPPDFHTQSPSLTLSDKPIHTPQCPCQISAWGTLRNAFNCRKRNIIGVASNIQGDTSGSSQGLVEIKTKVEF